MPYELTSLLLKCEAEDFDVLIKQIDSYVNFSSDAELKELLASYKEYSSIGIKTRLANTIEREIRYVGSSDAAYACRRLFGSDEPAGVSIHEIIDDAYRARNTKPRPLGTPEAKMERFAKLAAEKTFFSLSPAQQRELFERAGIQKEQQNIIFEKLKENKTRFLPLLMSVLGKEITATILEGLAITALAIILGKKAATELIKHLVARFPWWAEWMGPIVWDLSLGWLAIDLQGPATRKTIPILLYLGIVGLRDGPEDGEDFWKED